MKGWVDEVSSPSHSLTLNILHPANHPSTDWRRWWKSTRVSKRTKQSNASVTQWLEARTSDSTSVSSSPAYCCRPFYYGNDIQQHVLYRSLSTSIAHAKKNKILKRRIHSLSFRSKSKNKTTTEHRSDAAFRLITAAHLALNRRCFTRLRVPPAVNAHRRTSPFTRRPKSSLETPQRLLAQVLHLPVNTFNNTIDQNSLFGRPDASLTLFCQHQGALLYQCEWTERTISSEFWCTARIWGDEVGWNWVHFNPDFHYRVCWSSSL